MRIALEIVVLSARLDVVVPNRNLMTGEPWLDYHSIGVPVACRGFNRVSYTRIAGVQLSPFKKIVFKWVKFRVPHNLA
jgi:hypothetical protein